MRRHRGERGGGQPREGVACLGFAVVVVERELPASSLRLHSSCQGCELHPWSRAGQDALWSLILAGFCLKSKPYARNYSSSMKDPVWGCPPHCFQFTMLPDWWLLESQLEDSHKKPQRSSLLNTSVRPTVRARPWAQSLRSQPPGSRKSWVQISGLPLPSCVTLGKPLNLSGHFSSFIKWGQPLTAFCAE